MVNVGSAILGDNWEADLAAFRADPSIRNYLAIREKHSDREPPNDTYGGLDPLFAMQAELERWGIQPLLVAGVLDADREAIEQLSLKLLDLMLERQKLEEVGETHVQARGLAIPDRLIDYLIVVMFEAMECNNEAHAVGSLNFLIRERLGGANMALHQAYLKKRKKDEVVSVLATARRQGKDVSIRQIAKWMKIQPSSITRLFEPGELEQRIELFLRQPSLLQPHLEG